MRVLIAPALLLGCATTRPDAARESVNQLVGERMGLTDTIEPAIETDALARVSARVDELLSEPLDEATAVRVALLNNRSYQAKLEELGIAQAELVQAGLLENPVIGGDLKISTLGNGFGGGASLSQSLLSVFLIPAKKRLAKADLQRAVVVAGDASMELVRDTKIAWADFEAAREVLRLTTTIVQIAEVADEMSALQLASGNVTELERAKLAAEFDMAKVELLAAEVELAAAREAVNLELGLWGRQLVWTPQQQRSTGIPNTESPLGEIVELGVDRRLDLSAARFSVTALTAALQLRRRGLVPQVEVGVDAGNEVGSDVGHEWVVGPSLSIELPIFDPGHADLARIRAQLRQAEHHLASMAIAVRSDIRLKRERLIAARRLAEYFRDTVVPRHQEIFDRSAEQYNGMLLGAFEFFETREHQLEVMCQQTKVQRDYWVALAELEYAAGGLLPE